jgi:hypothetical protein
VKKEHLPKFVDVINKVKGGPPPLANEQKGSKKDQLK